MKIIIAGAGEVGTYLAKMLYNVNHDIIVIDNDENKLQVIDSHFDFLTVKGSATSIETLKDADIKRADLFIAVTPIEEINITAAILGKKLGAKKVIARVNNHEFLEPKNREFITEMGIDSIVYPEILASEEVVSLIEQSATSKKFDFSSGFLSLYVLRLKKNSPIIGKTLKEAAEDNEPFDYRTVAITRESKTIIPHGNDRFQKNDTLYIITSKAGIDQLITYIGGRNFNIKNVMILGGSRIGKKTAKTLENKLNVKLLEINKEKSFELADFLNNTLVVNSDGTDIDVLIEEGIKEMDAFIAVTGNSETNLLTCLIAKKFGVKKTIAEIENLEYIQIAENMGIDSVINKKLIAASHIYGFTMSAEVATVQCVTSTDAEALELVVHNNSVVTRNKIKDLKFPKDAIIGGVVRGNSSFIAKGETQLLVGDKVIVFTLPIAIKKVNQLFK
ncbi:MAG: Trk system potassium transporter TrkA [Bacteroidales bacterium]|nr:Trk system potassium transporter TrkA [Bacteroidales bacterium]MBN2758574.1 Trk system potassium transporter TrkA [Bacteroidales bacterium]